MKIFDFKKYPLSHISYGGSVRKIGILIDNQPYMLKFQKRTSYGLRFNTISEYIGSHLFRLLGMNCQDTILGTYGDEMVVGCRDFNQDGYQFVPFNDIEESTIEDDKEKYQYSYEDILTLLTINQKLTNVVETVSSFFDLYLVDALLGNFDRHGSNWGFLKKDGKYRLAPIFDNDSCLYPNMDDENEMLKVISSEDEINLRVYDFPLSQIRLNDSKSSYFEVISSLKFKEMNDALKRIVPRINLEEIDDIIDEISLISEVHKTFYKTMIKHRYDKILKYSYDKLRSEGK